MKKLILPILMSLLLVTNSSCQKEEDLKPQIQIEIENPMRTLLVSNGQMSLIVAEAPWTQVMTTNLTVRKGTVIKVKAFGCGIGGYTPSGQLVITGGTANCTAIVTVIGVGDYSVIRGVFDHGGVDWTVP